MAEWAKVLRLVGYKPSRDFLCFSSIQSFALFPTSGDSIVKVTAVDQDDPHTSNAIIRYKIIAQRPWTSEGGMFDINPVSGMIGVKASGLDREVTNDVHEWFRSMFSVALHALRPSDSTRIQAGRRSGWPGGGGADIHLHRRHHRHRQQR